MNSDLDLDKLTFYGIVGLGATPLFLMILFGLLGDRDADLNFFFLFYSIPVALIMYLFYRLKHEVTTNIEIIEKVKVFLYRIMQICLLSAWVMIIFNVVEELMRYNVMQYFDISFLWGG